VSVCADGAYSAMIRIKKLHEFIKNEKKYLGGYRLLRRAKSDSEEN